MRRAICLLLLLVAASARAAEAHVSYVSGSSIYLDAGRDQGIAVGMSVELLRDTEVVGHLIVRHVASSRAACDLVDGPTPRPGDLVRYEPTTIPRDATPRTAAAPSSWQGVIGLRQNALWEQSGHGEDFVRPAIDLRLDGRSIGGRALDLRLDARAHRSFSSGSEDYGRTRVYRAQMDWRGAGALRVVSLGRQRSSQVPTLGSFDGLSAEFAGGERWRYGLASGTQPDPHDWAPSGDIFESAAFAKFSERQWTLGVSAVGSYEESEISREYGITRLTLGGARSRLLVHQEFDLYRGWRKDAEGRTLQATSRYVTARHRFNARWVIAAGTDSRRRLRLYRDRNTPETAFDDAFRTGTWGALQIGFAGGASVELRGRTRRGGESGAVDEGSLTVRRLGLPYVPVRWGARASRYDNDFLDGWLGSLQFEAEGERWRWQSDGGYRGDRGKVLAFEDHDVWWVGSDLQFQVDPHWSLSAAWDWYDGGDDARQELYSALSYRFW